MSLEALISSCWPQVALQKTYFFKAIKLLIAIGSLFACTNGERATPPSRASIGAYNVLL